jgi:UPF0755 protein
MGNSTAKKKTRGLGFLAAALGFMIVLVAASMTLAYALNLAPEAMAESTLFTVERGSSGSKVAVDLEARGLIRSSAFFKLVQKVSGSPSKIKSGTFRIPRGSTATSIYALISSGRQATERLTVPEGYTRKQIAELLGKSDICSARDFLDITADPSFLAEEQIPFSTAEGFLFPDTYEFPMNSEPEAVARGMIQAFFRVLRREFPETTKDGQAETMRKLIVASIVEREYRVDSEAPLMASVFYNRLRIRMALESCATVVYVITEIQGKPHPSVIYDRDLDIQSDYNTYLHNGLPPGPISNPGLTALRAAFAPAASKYLYFRLVDPETGSHHFSVSFDEHIKAGRLQGKAISTKK